jgi:hypothetical protein
MKQLAISLSLLLVTCFGNATTPPITTILNLNGDWLYEGTWGAHPVITVSGNDVIVDMAAYGRPTAKGVIVNSNTIKVTFSDDGTFTGTLVRPNLIKWSNGTTWSKAPTIFDLNGVWQYNGVDGPVIAMSGNNLSVDMSAYKRPTATGIIIRGNTIKVTFTDDATFVGTLVRPNRIRWNNFTEWVKRP